MLLAGIEVKLQKFLDICSKENVVDIKLTVIGKKTQSVHINKMNLSRCELVNWRCQNGVSREMQLRSVLTDQEYVSQIPEAALGLLRRLQKSGFRGALDMKYQTNYETVSKQFRNTILYYERYTRADCGSDHLHFVSCFSVKRQKLNKTKRMSRFLNDPS